MTTDKKAAQYVYQTLEDNADGLTADLSRLSGEGWDPIGGLTYLHATDDVGKPLFAVLLRRPA